MFHYYTLKDYAIKIKLVNVMATEYFSSIYPQAPRQCSKAGGGGNAY